MVSLEGSLITRLGEMRTKMYLELGDTLAIIIALSVSTTLVITTAIKNARLVRELRKLSK